MEMLENYMKNEGKEEDEKFKAMQELEVKQKELKRRSDALQERIIRKRKLEMEAEKDYHDDTSDYEIEERDMFFKKK